VIPLRDSAQGVSFAVRVQPRAARTGISGVLGEGEGAALKLALAAPPLDGRANAELMDFFADFFAVPRFAVDVIAGLQSRNKVVRITGRTAQQARALLAKALAISS
jgi:uncharacterized protein (TIGR00251 family)